MTNFWYRLNLTLKGVEKMENLLETRRASKSYGKQLALNNVSIHVRQGEIYGLIGKNGAGKSTLFKVIMSLAQLDSGEISLYGETASDRLIGAQKNIGFMFGSQFFPYLTARENLIYSCKLKGITNLKEVDRVLELVELTDVNKKVKSYSMGMKQRLNIGNALLGNPDLILMDEPINGLDPQGIASFRQMIQRLNQEQNVTFLLSSHILGELGLIGSRFGFIHEGNLLQEIDRKELFAQTQDQLVIQVDQVGIATSLLEENIEGIDYFVNGDKEIVVNKPIEAADKMAKVLIDAGLSLYKLAPHQQTLEDYYLSLIHQGGVAHV